MYLSSDSIIKEIKGIQAQKRIFMKQDFLDFIGKKCIEVLKEVTESKKEEFVGKKVPLSYEQGHNYKTEILANSSRIILQNLGVNQFGEYISSYIENGTGIYSEQTTRPNGWIYPTTEEDKNTTKRMGKQGDLIAYTKGQKAKNIYYNAMQIIEQKLDEWIEEYWGG